MQCPKCSLNMVQDINDDFQPIYKCLSCGKEMARTETHIRMKREIAEEISQRRQPVPEMEGKKEQNPEKPNFEEAAKQCINPRPAKPKGGKKGSIKAFYEDNKARIIDDYTQLGCKATLELWQIDAGGLYNFLRDWGIRIDRKHPHIPAQRKAYTPPIPLKLYEVDSSTIQVAEVSHPSSSEHASGEARGLSRTRDIDGGSVALVFNDIDFFSLAKPYRDWICELLAIWELGDSLHSEDKHDGHVS